MDIEKKGSLSPSVIRKLCGVAMSKKEINSSKQDEKKKKAPSNDMTATDKEVKMDGTEVQSGDTSSSVSPQEAKIAELEAEIARLAKELETEKEQFMRKMADMDNYRKRLIREKESAILYANEKLINDLVPILDDFDRAVAASGTATDVDSYVEGIKIIQAQFVGMLEKNWGLKVMEHTEGKEFSPHEHEACMMEQGEQYKHDTVLAELQKGYYLHDRVLRTAKVKVGKPI